MEHTVTLSLSVQDARRIYNAINTARVYGLVNASYAKTKGRTDERAEELYKLTEHAYNLFRELYHEGIRAIEDIPITEWDEYQLWPIAEVKHMFGLDKEEQTA